ncbi:MAG: nicotinamide-nucleotide amidohydrolase family protein [Thermomicrobiales bacterium]
MTTSPAATATTTTPTLEERLFALLGAQDAITVGTAESCTGGNVAHHITRIAGSSAYFLGGIVSYANSVKHGVLGVPEDVLRNPGAVSAPCAIAMAEGARRVLGTTLAVSTTGIAGPGGATAFKPVGLVYLAIAGDGLETQVEEHRFSGDREAVIAASTTRALELLVDAASRLIANAETGRT